MYMMKTEGWRVESATFLGAGIMTLTSVAPALLHSVNWLVLTGFAGVNLVILATTGSCLMSNIPCKPGLKPRLARGQAERCQR